MCSAVVVIPTLGRASLPTAVESAIRQSHPPSRIVIVHNGPATQQVDLPHSSDTTLEVRRLPYRSGPSVPRNFGVMGATEDVVAFLDDDDVFAATYLEHMVAIHASDGADVVVGATVRAQYGREDARRSDPTRVPRERWLSYLLSGQNPGVSGQNLLFRRESFVDLGGFDPLLGSGEDRELIVRALRARLRIATAPSAEVVLRPPKGERSSGGRLNSLDDLRILATHWHAATWGDRQRYLRTLVSRERRDRRRRRGSTLAHARV